jgi:hypothetical protein
VTMRANNGEILAIVGKQPMPEWTGE